MFAIISSCGMSSMHLKMLGVCKLLKLSLKDLNELQVGNIALKVFFSFTADNSSYASFQWTIVCPFPSLLLAWSLACTFILQVRHQYYEHLGFWASCNQERFYFNFTSCLPTSEPAERTNAPSAQCQQTDQGRGLKKQMINCCMAWWTFRFTVEIANV